MTSASRTDPPGWTTARTPASSSTCRPSAKGKKASEAATEPVARSPARVTARRGGGPPVAPPPPPPPRARQAGGVHPVDLPHADADGRLVVGEQDRVAAHGPHCAPGEDEIVKTGGVQRLPPPPRPRAAGPRRGGAG